MRSISLAKRVLRDRRGNAAVEFALIAFPFFLLLFAILEVTFMFFLTTTLENAAVEASRKIRTGEIQNSGGTAQTFRDEVCAGVAVLVTCSGSNTYVDVRTYTDFNAITTPNPVTDGDFDPSGLTADFGVAGDIVVARVYFLWDVIMPDLGTGLSNLNGGKRLITATAAFRNEPFGTVSSSTATSSGSSTGSSSTSSELQHDHGNQLRIHHHHNHELKLRFDDHDHDHQLGLKLEHHHDDHNHQHDGRMSMPCLFSRLAGFARARDGASALEFALIAPTLVLFYFATVELSILLTVDRKVTNVASAVGDLVAQDDLVDSAEVTDIFDAASAIMAPYDDPTIQMRVTSIGLDASSNPVVLWSEGRNLTPLGCGATVSVPAGLITAGQSVIQAEVTHQYASPIAQFLKTTLTLEDTFYLRPRRSDTVANSTAACP